MPRRSPIPAVIPPIPLTPGVPCPRCAGLVIVRAVVTPEGSLTEHYCVACARSSHQTPTSRHPPSRIRLTPQCERALERVARALGREGVRTRGYEAWMEDCAALGVPSSVFDRIEGTLAFEAEFGEDD